MSAETPAGLLPVAIEAAQRAGDVLKARFHSTRTIDFKGQGRHNIVTDADRASEEVLLEALCREFPSHGIVAEESGALGAQTGIRWYVDPLDGTTNYAHHVPHFSVSIAAADDSGLLVAVVLDPLRNELFAAARGAGATLNGERMVVSTTAELDTSLLCTGFPYDLQQNPLAPLGLFNRLVKRAQGIRRMGSAALDLAYVACGRYDGYFEFGLKSWDTAAGALLVTESGGVMTRIDGQPYQVRYGDILCATPAIATPLQAECTAFLAEVGWKPKLG